MSGYDLRKGENSSEESPGSGRHAAIIAKEHV